MNDINKKIIEAVIRRAEQVCPDSLELIGVYGSVGTEDEYEKSDLDLLILIKDEAGYQLATGFILDDSGVGYDVYCTTWDSLKYDAQCRHAHLSKLMDSRIVYVRNQEACEQLYELRENAKQLLASDERFARADELLNKAKAAYADALLHEGLNRVRMDAFETVNCVADALMLFHGEYFRRGVKKMLDELSRLPVEKQLIEGFNSIALSNDALKIRALIKEILLYALEHTSREQVKKPPSQELSGTYEEIFSNWRNKMELAEKSRDVFFSFMNMCSADSMLREISSVTQGVSFDMLGQYNPDKLGDNVTAFDEMLEGYEGLYKAAGLQVRRFSDVDEFVCAYGAQ